MSMLVCLTFSAHSFTRSFQNSFITQENQIQWQLKVFQQVPPFIFSFRSDEIRIELCKCTNSEYRFYQGELIKSQQVPRCVFNNTQQ